MVKFANTSVLFVLFLGIFSMCQAAGIEDLLNDEALVRRQIACVLERGSCDALGKSIKGLVTEIVRNKCGKCTPQQSANADRIIKFLKQRYPAEWHMIASKYA